MSATVGAAIRDAIVTGVPGTKVFMDYAPEKTPPPYVTFNDAVAGNVALVGNTDVIAYSRQAQVDVWMSKEQEDLDLVLDIRNALDTARLNLDYGFVSHASVDSFERIPEPFESNLTHWALTVTLAHGANAI